MSREELEKATCKELQEMCKDRSIPYSTHSKKFTKSQMVEALLEAEATESRVDDHIVVKEKETIVVERRNHDEYLSKVGHKVGKAKSRIKVAFAVGDNKVRTAKIANISYKRRELKVQARGGEEFVIPFDDVLWVKDKGYWPYHIMIALKSEGERDVVIK